MMKNFIKQLLLILLISSPTLLCQKQGMERIDSLTSVLTKIKNDTLKIDKLNQLAYKFQIIDLEKTKKYAEDALELSQKIKYTKGEAEALNNFGIYYDRISDYPKALDNYQKALKLDEQLGNKTETATVLGNIGNFYMSPSNYEKALNYFQRSLKLFDELHDTSNVASMIFSIGSAYSNISDNEQALQYFQSALIIYGKLGNQAGIAAVLSNVGNVELNLSDYGKALEFYKKALALDEKLGYNDGVASNLANIGYLYLQLAQDTSSSHLESKSSATKNKKNILDSSVVYSVKAQKIALEISSKEMLVEIYDNLQLAYKANGNFEEAYHYYEKLSEIKDSLFSIEKTKQIAKLEAQKDKEVAEKELKVQKLANLKSQNESFFLLLGIFLLALVIFVIYRQRRASDRLLLNILPVKIAKRLKRNEKYIADKFDEASVIFIDQVSFTDKSAGSKPEDVVASLDEIYTKFDFLADKYGLEKIKTIGDCYMAASGIPEPREDHTEAAAKFAIEAMDISNEKISFRCGIDCGPVIGGVIGRKKFIYDLWGDTVNTAARMESSSQPGKIQVTDRFRHDIKSNNKIKGMVFADRGEIEVKGKGMMRTWFLEKS